MADGTHDFVEGRLALIDAPPPVRAIGAASHRVQLDSVGGDLDDTAVTAGT
jgi:hypothetical protein